jgi:hypothetical protein
MQGQAPRNAVNIGRRGGRRMFHAPMKLLEDGNQQGETEQRVDIRPGCGGPDDAGIVQQPDDADESDA